MSGVSITGLDPASTLTGSEIVPIVQSGTTVRTTLAAMPYVPAGTGAVTTSVQAKLRETVSVKDFGAVGDGVVDDTAAIQTAVDYAITNSVKLFAPSGTYKLTAQINIYLPYNSASTFWLEGELTGTKFSIAHTGDGLKIAGSGGTGVIDQGARVKISSCQFQSSTASSIIYNVNGINVQLDNLHFADVTTTVATIVNQTAYGLRITNSVWRYCFGDGVRYKVAPAEVEYSFICSIENCDFSGQYGNCVYAEGTAGLLLKHTVFQNSLQGILLDSVVNSNFSMNVNIISCWFEQNVTADISAPSNISYWSEINHQSCHYGYRKTAWGGAATLNGLINLGAKSKIVIQGIAYGGPQCEVLGSANASAILIGTTGYYKTGSFSWNYFANTGVYDTPYFRITSSSTTTGDISLASPTTLTVASGRSIYNNDQIKIAGAGAAGADLITSVVSGEGTTTITLLHSASTAVTNAVVTVNSNSTENNFKQTLGAFVNEQSQTTAATGVATTIKTFPTASPAYRQTYIVSVSIDSGNPTQYYCVGLATTSALTWRYTALQTATFLSVTFSGANLQVTQTSGAVQNVSWTLTRVS